MKNEEKLVKIFLRDDVNLAVSLEWGSSCFVTELITNVINEEAINQNKRVLFVTNLKDSKEDRGWYMANLIALISGIDVKTVLSYTFPFSYQLSDKERKEIGDLPHHKKYLNALKIIKNSDLMIESTIHSYYGPLYFLFDEGYQEKYDLIIIKDLNLLFNDPYFHSEKYQDNQELIAKEAINFLVNYSKKHQAKILCIESGIAGYRYAKYFKNRNVLYVDQRRINGYLTHFLSNGDLIKLDNTNKIVEYLGNEYLIYNKLNEARNNSKVIAIKNYDQDDMSVNKILQKYLFQDHDNIKFCAFGQNIPIYTYEDYQESTGKEILDSILSYRNNQQPYDYIIIHGFNKAVDKIHLPYEEVLKELYDYAKYEEMNIIIWENDNFIKDDLGLVDSYITFSRNEDAKMHMIVSNKTGNDKFVFVFDESIGE